MRIDIYHPAMAEGIENKGPDSRIVAGMVTTPYELIEVDADGMLPAFEIEGRPTVFQSDELFYVEAGPAPSEGETLDIFRLSEGAANGKAETGGHLKPYDRECAAALADLFRQRGAKPQSLNPAFPGGVFDLQGNAYAYFLKAGDVAKRKTRVNEDDIPEWRAAASRYMDAFRVSGGRMYVRCHEPLLLAYPGGVQLSNTSFFHEHVDLAERRASVYDYRLTDEGEEPRYHAFPMDHYDAARRMSEVLSVEFPMVADDEYIPPFRVLGQPSPLGDILDRELARIATLHLDRRWDYEQGYARRAHLPDGPAKAEAYCNVPGTRLKSLVHATNSRAPNSDAEAIRLGIEAFLAIDDEKKEEPYFEEYDRLVWERLVTASRLVMERCDNAPINALASAAQAGYLPGIVR